MEKPQLYSRDELNQWILVQRWKDMTPSRLELLPDVLSQVVSLYGDKRDELEAVQLVTDTESDVDYIRYFCDGELYIYRQDHEQALLQMEQKLHSPSLSDQTSKLHRNVLVLSSTICIYPFLDLDTSQLQIMGMMVGKTPLFSLLLMAFLVLTYHLISYMDHAVADAKRLISFKLEYIARKRAAFLPLSRGAIKLKKNLKSHIAKQCLEIFVLAFASENMFYALITAEGYDPGNEHIHSFPGKKGFFYRLKFFGFRRALGYVFPIFVSVVAVVITFFAKDIHFWWQGITGYIF